MIVLSAVDFGCHDPQTLCQLTSLCGDFLNRAYCNSPRHLEDLENNTEQAVAGTDQHTLREGAKNCEKGKCLSYKVVDIFSICRNYRLLNIFLVSLKKKKLNLNKYFTVYGYVLYGTPYTMRLTYIICLVCE